MSDDRHGTWALEGGSQHAAGAHTDLAIDEEEALPRLLEGDVGEAMAPAEARWRHDWLAICADPVIVARRRVRAPETALSAVLCTGGSHSVARWGRQGTRGFRANFVLGCVRGGPWCEAQHAATSCTQCV